MKKTYLSGIIILFFCLLVFSASFVSAEFAYCDTNPATCLPWEISCCSGCNPGGGCLGVCGDGGVANLEECDDGNTANNDGCSSACMFEKCKIYDISINTSNCKNNVCGEGRTILFNVNISGDCALEHYAISEYLPAPDYLYVSLSGQGCNVKYAGGDMIGVYENYSYDPPPSGYLNTTLPRPWAPFVSCIHEPDPPGCRYTNYGYGYFVLNYSSKIVLVNYTIPPLGSCLDKTLNIATVNLVDDISDLSTNVTGPLEKTLTTPIRLKNCGDGYCNNNIGENNNICPVDCQAECGNSICEAPNENNNTCFYDCPVNGWVTYDKVGWSYENGSIKASRKNIDMYYDKKLKLKTGKTYKVSADIYNKNLASSNCYASVHLKNGKCTDARTWVPDSDCFVSNNSELYNAIKVVGVEDWERREGTILIPTNNPNKDSDGYINGVTLSLSVYCGEGQSGNLDHDIYFDNIDIREVASDVHYDYQDMPSSIDSANACCPKDWCFDGAKCVDGKLWTSNSSYEPVWNNIFTPDKRWFSNHVNMSDKRLAIGYRCIVNDTGFADWRRAEIKYDWDSNESGYCNKPTDCFVGKGATYAENASCTPNGTFVNDTGTQLKGNHYCHEGNWTSRTHIAASYLQQWSGTKPYILICDTGGFNNPSYDDLVVNDHIDSACTIIIKKSVDTEHNIIALIPKDNSSEHLGSVFEIINSQYHNSFGKEPGLDIDAFCPLITPPETEWSICTTNPAIEKLFVYINNNYGIVFISDKTITDIDQNFLQRIWSSIKGFFSSLFGSPTQNPQFDLFNQTTNYENIYLLNNNTLKITGIEEQKYSERQMRIMNYLYINHTPSGMDYNINIKFINDTYKPYIFSYNYKEFILVSNESTNLWPYLTAMLRDRK